MLTLAIIFSLVLLNLFTTAWLLRWAARRMATGMHSWLRVLLLSLLIYAVGVGLYFLNRSLGEDVPVPVQLGILLGGQLLVAIVLLAKGMQTTLGRSVRLSLLALVPGLLLGVFVTFVVKPYMVEMFVVASSSMCPTLANEHLEGTCPHCSGRTMLPIHTYPRDGSRVPMTGICTACRATYPVDERDRPRSLPPTKSPDRFAVNKLHTPARWDMILFEHPLEPSLRYVKRLIGMPGETVAIDDDGVIHINGVKMPVPESLAGLRFERNDLGFAPEPNSVGTPNNPWRLGPEEYFVLGDLPYRSSDSRAWGPVPKANVVGVVTLTYWSLNRFKIWR